MGYSLALSPDKKRLFVPRHALGARSHSSWFGSTTVDALLLPAETPAAPMHEANLPGVSSTHLENHGFKYELDNQPAEAWSAFVQPRDIRYRRSLNTVVVVSEGADRLVELDAMAMDPANASAKEVKGVPRRTPMLVGRVSPVGSYGWRGESATLEKRIEAGTQLHAGESPRSVPEYYVNALAVFLRKGLAKPPARTASLTPEEQKGKALFEDSKTACSVCHEPTRYLSNYKPMKLGALPTLAGFEPEPDALFKTPSLLYVGQHGSLLHDGSAKTLEELFEKNGTRMGDTAHLTPEERRALVAYLKTL